jgi:hypothetical protein
VKQWRINKKQEIEIRGLGFRVQSEEWVTDQCREEETPTEWKLKLSGEAKSIHLRWSDVKSRWREGSHDDEGSLKKKKHAWYWRVSSSHDDEWFLFFVSYLFIFKRLWFFLKKKKLRFFYSKVPGSILVSAHYNIICKNILCFLSQVSDTWPNKIGF